MLVHLALEYIVLITSKWIALLWKCSSRRYLVHALPPRRRYWIYYFQWHRSNMMSLLYMIMLYFHFACHFFTSTATNTTTTTTSVSFLRIIYPTSWLFHLMTCESNYYMCSNCGLSALSREQLPHLFTSRAALRNSHDHKMMAAILTRTTHQIFSPPFLAVRSIVFHPSKSFVQKPAEPPYSLATRLL